MGTSRCRWGIAVLATMGGLASSGAVVRADYTYTDHFDNYTAGTTLAGQHGWASLAGSPDNLISGAALSGTPVSRYAVSPGSSGQAEDILPVATLSGVVTIRTLQRLDVADLDAAGVYFNQGTSLLAGSSLNNRFGDGNFYLVNDYGQGSFAETATNLGSESGLDGHWFSVDVVLNLGADTMTTHVHELDQLISPVDVTIGPSPINPAFAPDAIGAYTGWNGKVALVPEPTTIGILGALGTGILCRRRRPSSLPR